MIRNFNEQRNRKLCLHEKRKIHFIELDNVLYLIQDTFLFC
jgi:hypothetical protein